MTNLLPLPGTPVENLDTPCLVLDLDVLERNIETMHAFFRGRPAKVRNVTKGHKCPAIAQKQMAAEGSIPAGLCCAKISEAEVMAAAGARHIRMIEQVVGRAKILRLVNLARHTHVIALVDDPTHVRELAEAADACGVTLDVMIEVEIGLNRCGVAPGAPTRDLAAAIRRHRRLRFAGIGAHEGTIADTDRHRRADRVRERVQRLLNAREDLERAGIAVDICGAGSTTSWNIAGDMPGITEIDPGSYVLMDAGLAEAIPDIEFAPAISVVLTVISRPTKERAVIDGGHKALGRSADGGMPSVSSHPGATVARLNSEHGIVDVGTSEGLNIGDRVMLVPRYHGSVVLGYDHFIGVRGGRVECLWDIACRTSHQ